MCHRRAAVAMCFEFNAQLGGRENLIVGIEETICVKFALKMAGKKYTVKRKYEDEHRRFLTEWQSLYCFVERNGKPFCLISQASLAHFKASKLQRHFTG